MYVYLLAIVCISVFSHGLHASSFEEYCEDSSLPLPQKHFIDSVLRAFDTDDCSVPQQHVDAANEIDLSNLSLRDVSLLPSLKGIKRLILKNNIIHDTQFLNQMDLLQYIDLSFNLISNVSSLSKAKNLVHFNISNNQIEHIDFLPGITSLREVDLRGNRIVDYSPVEKMTGLEVLKVGAVDIFESPKCRYQSVFSEVKFSRYISKLHRLQVLEASHMDFHSLPKTQNHPDMKSLNLNCNFIETVTLDKSNRNLAVLRLGGNRIAKIVVEAPLDKIRYLAVQDNYLGDSDFLKMLPNLVVLDISNNLLQGKFDLRPLRYLMRLNVSSNRIDEIIELGFSSEVLSGNFSNNLLSNFPFKSFSTNSVVLNLSKNKISRLDGIEDLEKIREIHLDQNPVENFMPINSIKSARSIYLSVTPLRKNQLHEVINPNIRSLRVASANITSLDQLPSLPKLNGLYIPDNNMPEINGLSKTYPELRGLDISGNPIYAIGSLEYLPDINYLKIASIRSVDFTPISLLSNLHTLDISRNKISDLSFLPVSALLQRLDIHGNAIESIEPLAKYSDSLYFLDASRNRVSSIKVLGKFRNINRSTNLNLGSNPLGTTVKKNSINCPTESLSKAVFIWCNQ